MASCQACQALQALLTLDPCQRGCTRKGNPPPALEAAPPKKAWLWLVDPIFPFPIFILIADHCSTALAAVLLGRCCKNMVILLEEIAITRSVWVLTAVYLPLQTACLPLTCILASAATLASCTPSPSCTLLGLPKRDSIRGNATKDMQMGSPREQGVF